MTDTDRILRDLITGPAKLSYLAALVGSEDRAKAALQELIRMRLVKSEIDPDKPKRVNHFGQAEPAIWGARIYRLARNRGDGWRGGDVFASWDWRARGKYVYPGGIR